MAEPQQGKVYIQPPFDPAVLERRPLLPAVRWGAIFAGVAASISVQLVLTLFGIATGLSTANLASSKTGAAMGSLLWAGASMLIAAFIGGYVAARMSGFKRKADGVLHGLVSWAVTTLLFASVAASAGGSLLGGIFNTMGQSAIQSSTQIGSPITNMLRAQVGRIDTDALQTLQQDIEAGRRDDAVEVLVGAARIDPERAARIVDQAMIVSGSGSSASPQARLAAERAIGDAGASAWILFAAVALALAVAIAGGVVGAMSARRTTWTTNSLTSPA